MGSLSEAAEEQDQVGLLLQQAEEFQSRSRPASSQNNPREVRTLTSLTIQVEYLYVKSLFGEVLLTLINLNQGLKPSSKSPLALCSLGYSLASLVGLFIVAFVNF